ncbi:hypothetical protein KJ840_04285 [Patescibacteria group bacterium]|nr:hypothetical protein [Patescibacteria group bacterium]
MPIFESQTPYWLLIITSLGAALISGIVSLIIGFNVEKKKIRPQITTHGCRISDLSVYTYFNENNKTSAPACPFISKDGQDKCNYIIEENDDKKDRKEEMLKINNNICYLSRWILKK